jgi:hypothetical protein
MAITLVGLWPMPSAFNLARLDTSLMGITARHHSRPLPGLRCTPGGRWQPPDRGVSGGEEEAVMGVAKKAKHGAKAAKGKTKKGAGKVKHKGKKAKNAAKH